MQKALKKTSVIKSTHTQGTCYQIPTYAKHLLSNLYIRKAPDNISTHTPIFVYLLKVFRYVSTHTNRAFSTYPSEAYIAENNVKQGFSTYFLDIKTTHSTCPVLGNKSTPQTLSTLKPFLLSHLASRAAVAGLHEIIIIFLGFAFEIISKVFSEHPFRGGSITIISE